jgi:hypothetical protein
LLANVHHRCAAAINWPVFPQIRTKSVKRRVPFFLYVGAIIALACCVTYFGWVRTWSSVYVPTMYPPFADMRVIQGAVSSVKLGYDPRKTNVGDPWRRPFNYPMLWVSIGETLNITNEQRFIDVCAALLLCFVGLCAFWIFHYPSYGLLTSLVSTSTLLGMERGNIDLAIFCLLFAAQWVPKRWSPLPLLLSVLLKLYPVFTLGIMFIKRQFILFAASLVAAVAIVAYLWDQLAYIRSNTPVSCYWSYGVQSIAKCFTQSGWPIWPVWLLFAVVGLGALALAYYFSKSDAVRPKQDAAFDLMFVGAAIYVGTFIFSSNWDYRLIFLIMCIPFLQFRRFPFARAVTAVTLVAMNETLIMHWGGLGGLIVTQLAKTATFGVLSAYLLALTYTTLASIYDKTKPVEAAAAAHPAEVSQGFNDRSVLREAVAAAIGV